MPSPAAGHARACWIVAPGHAELRDEPLPPPAAGEVRVRNLHGAVSRGTEGLVYRGEVPASEAVRMRAPFQVGDFLSGPVKYGYIGVGVVESGPSDLTGRTVFCLHPHQTHYNVPAAAVLPLPAGVPPARAVLAAQLETAVNALWDEPPRIGDSLAVVGGGVVGLLVAWLAAQVPGCRVELVDTNPARAAIAARLGARFVAPDEATPDADLVVHASGQGAGLATALRLAAFEATVLELSWYGRRAVELPLGEAFHARRLTLRSSQVGSVAPARRGSRTQRDRLALALGLLTDPALDALVTDVAPFDELPAVLARLSARPDAAPGALCQRIDYPGA